MSNILSFESEWVRRMPGRIQIIRFMREAIGVKEVKWDDLTAYNLSLVKDYICKRAGSSNTAVTYFADIKRFLTVFRKEGIVPCDEPEAFLKAKKEPQQNVALNEKELNLIVEYYDELMKKKNHKPEKDCLTLFLLEAFCGARSCDIDVMTASNIVNGMLTYVSIKTHVLATIPVHRRLAELISRKPKTVYSNTTKNRIIKRIAKKVGITQPVTIFYHGQMRTLPKYEYLGTHSARRSFASILSEKGVPIAEIAQYMSHTNTSMTERYIKVDSHKVSEAALSFFNG